MQKHIRLNNIVTLEVKSVTLEAWHNNIDIDISRKVWHNNTHQHMQKQREKEIDGKNMTEKLNQYVASKASSLGRLV